MKEEKIQSKAFAIFAETLRTLRLKKAGFYNFLKQNRKKFKLMHSIPESLGDQ